MGIDVKDYFLEWFRAPQPAGDVDAPSTVMAGLGPAIYAFRAAGAAARVKICMCAQRSALHRKPHRPAQAKSWMPGQARA